MSESLINYIIIYFICSLSILGYGLLLSNYSKRYLNEINIGEAGIVGILITIIYSTISHIFIAHGYFHNTIFIILGLIFFIYFYRNLSRLEIVTFIVVFSIILLCMHTPLQQCWV